MIKRKCAGKENTKDKGKRKQSKYAGRKEDLLFESEQLLSGERVRLRDERNQVAALAERLHAVHIQLF